MDPKENQNLQRETSEQRHQEIQQARQRIEKGEKPWEDEAGVMSVVDAVRDLEFPKSVDDIRNEAGDRQVHTSGKKQFPLDQVLGKLKENEFPSIRDFQTAVQKHWQGIQFMELPEDQQPEGGGGVPPQRLDDQ